MVDIPTQPQMTSEQAHQRLQEWYQKQAQLKSLKTHEHLERVALTGFFFRAPKEGTNRLDLGGGFDLKLQYGYNYKVDEADLDQVKATDIKKLKLPWDDLFKYKPELVKSVYNGLSSEQKKFVDQILEIKEASPQLEIVPQADREGQVKHQAATQLGKDAGASPEAASSADGSMQVVLDAESATPGQYYNDGETWWQLGDDIEWAEIEDPDDIELLDKLLEDASPPAPAPRRRRKAAK